jgi:hypothetical protein
MRIRREMMRRDASLPAMCPADVPANDRPSGGTAYRSTASHGWLIDKLQGGAPD